MGGIFADCNDVREVTEEGEGRIRRTPWTETGRGSCVAQQEREERARVLDPVSRISEIIFGRAHGAVLHRCAQCGDDWLRRHPYDDADCAGLQPRVGLVDAVMSLVSALAERGRNLTLLGLVRGAVNPQEAYRSIAESLPGRRGGILGPEDLAC